jgi:hypothetical protein
MRFNLRRELSAAFQYFALTLVAGGFAIHRWNVATHYYDCPASEVSANGSSLIVDCSFREVVYHVTKHYLFPLVGIFLTLAAIRLLLIFVLSRSQRGLG